MVRGTNLCICFKMSKIYNLKGFLVMEIHLAIEFVRPTSVGVLWFNVKGYLNYMPIIKWTKCAQQWDWLRTHRAKHLEGKNREDQNRKKLSDARPLTIALAIVKSNKMCPISRWMCENNKHMLISTLQKYAFIWFWIFQTHNHACYMCSCVFCCCRDS